MKPEEYYEKYIKLTTEMSAYMQTYVETIIGEPEVDIEDRGELQILIR